jgi:hypothetical protein
MSVNYVIGRNDAELAARRLSGRCCHRLTIISIRIIGTRSLSQIHSRSASGYVDNGAILREYPAIY